MRLTQSAAGRPAGSRVTVATVDARRRADGADPAADAAPTATPTPTATATPAADEAASAAKRAKLKRRKAPNARASG